MGPEVTDLEWLRATFPGANIYLMSLGHDYSISFANRLVTLPVASAATRNEHAIRRTLGIRNDVGCEGAYIYYDEGGFRHRRVRDDDVRPAWTAQQVAASINALEAFCRAVSAPRVADGPRPLEKHEEYLVRKSVERQSKPATLPPPAVVEPPKCTECGAACPGASMCVYCLHRLDNATRSPLHRASELGPSAVLDAVGEARERLDTEPSFHEGCAAWASACWDGEDWGKP